MIRGARKIRRGVLIVVVCALCVGCARTQYAELRSRAYNPLEPVLHMAGYDRPQPSRRTVQLLRRFALDEDFEANPTEAIQQIEALEASDPSLELVYALAETNYVFAARQATGNPEAAYNGYWNCVAHAYRYLISTRYEEGRNVFDPQFRRACDLYNVSLEKCLRTCKEKGAFHPGGSVTLPTAGGDLEVVVVTKDFQWQPEDFDEFLFTSDYEIHGLTNHHRSFGLGVPLIAVRRGGAAANAASDGPEGLESYYPPNLSFPVTAFLRLAPRAPGESGPLRAQLELYDPLRTNELMVHGRMVPLESDLSTPLAHFLTENDPQKTATFGLLRPDKAERLAGLYMTQPYQPNKMPVIMIHGLWSSPMTWMEMFNDLRSQPEIRDKYQFWFFLYPTGQPFWMHAAHLRTELAEVRRVVDPHGYDPAMQHITLVGHSMGGLIARLASMDSEDRFWRVVSDQPFERMRGSEELRRQVQRIFFFEADPGIKRVVSIASPHRGSNYSNNFTQFVARRIIRMPGQMLASRGELLAENPDLFRDPSMLRNHMTSIDSLSPTAPLLPVLLDAPKPPWVRYHNIVAVKDDKVSPDRATDGVVRRRSAELHDVHSQLIVRADHAGAHRNPRAVNEVRRILLEHLAEVSPAPVETIHGPEPLFGSFLLPLAPSTGSTAAVPRFTLPSVRPTPAVEPLRTQRLPEVVAEPLLMPPLEREPSLPLRR